MSTVTIFATHHEKDTKFLLSLSHTFCLMRPLDYAYAIGPVVELVDALDSKSSVRKDVGVRFSPGPPDFLKALFSKAFRLRLPEYCLNVAYFGFQAIGRTPFP